MTQQVSPPQPEGAPQRLEGLPQDALRRARRAEGQGRPLHQRPLGERVPPHQGSGVPSPRPGARQQHLPHRLLGQGLELQPRGADPDPGDVRRPGAGHVAHGGGRRCWAPTASSACASTSASTSGAGAPPSSSPSAPPSALSRRATGRPPEGKPFTSDLSGQDFWVLLQSGHAPLGLVLGTCVYHVAHQGMFKAMGNIGQNREMPNFTQALYEARELAMERMQDEAKKLKAEGIVGVQIQEKSHIWGSHTIEFFAMGTAVRKLPEGEIATPRMVLSLDR